MSKLNAFLQETINDLRACADVAEIDDVLRRSVSLISKAVPEFNLYEGPARTSVEAGMHTPGATPKYYGVDLTMEAARAMLGAHCFLLSWAGTKNAYDAFVRKQQLLPGNKPVLSFGSLADTFADHTFSGMHNFLMKREESLAVMFYAALINDLGKTEHVKDIYRAIFSRDPEDNDETLGKVLEKYQEYKKLCEESGEPCEEFQAFDEMDVGNQKLITDCFSMPCTFSELQQIERPKQAAAKFATIAKEVLEFHFIMEYFGDVPGAVLPRADDGNIMVACQTMHQETVQHIQLLHRSFIEKDVPGSAFDFVAAYEEYADARLRAIGINSNQEDLKSIIPIVKLAVGVSRTATAARGAQILAMAQELPECVKEVLLHELETCNLHQSIYMLNIVPLVMGPFYLIAPKVKESLTVGLCVAACLYAETRKAFPEDRYDEFKGNASRVADLFTIKTIADIKDRIIPLYEKLKGITRIEEVAQHIADDLHHDIRVLPATNGVRFIAEKCTTCDAEMVAGSSVAASSQPVPYVGQFFSPSASASSSGHAPAADIATLSR